MAMMPFLAMTAAEMEQVGSLPEKVAWMACHFSPYGQGLSNLPTSLPSGSILIVDDLTPIHGHDPECITRQLLDCLDTFDLHAVLLDFQRPESPQTAQLTAYLSQALPCPLAVSEPYTHDSDLPVFLPPVPPSAPLKKHLKKWQDRPIWLDAGCWGEILTLTEDGCESVPLSPAEVPSEGFSDNALHCRYQIAVDERSAVFTLWRTREDLLALLEEAQALGVNEIVGLFQEYRILA